MLERALIRSDVFSVANRVDCGVARVNVIDLMSKVFARMFMWHPSPAMHTISNAATAHSLSTASAIIAV